jgi:hypothetical protein
MFNKFGDDGIGIAQCRTRAEIRILRVLSIPFGKKAFRLDSSRKRPCVEQVVERPGVDTTGVDLCFAL